MREPQIEYDKKELNFLPQSRKGGKKHKENWKEGKGFCHRSTEVGKKEGKFATKPRRRKEAQRKLEGGKGFLPQKH